jgi:spermidine/putrescine transport system ATP-binding protein
MGEVNVIDVRLGPGGRLASDIGGKSFTAPTLPAGFERGHLVIRPEFMRFLRRPEEAENSLVGRIYNEYALGSRIQYQVRVGSHVFVVEHLRQQSFAGRLDEEVLIGWDARDSILVRE